MVRGLFDEVVRCEVAVVGGGAAGLTAALGAAGRGVAVLSKSRFGRGGASVWAQGGMAAAVGEGDSPARHAADTLAVGGGLGVPATVELLTREGPRAVERLAALGVGFDRDPEGRLALGREAAHSHRRILHAGGDATGAELVRALTAAVRQTPGVRLLEEVFAHDLVMAQGRVVGVTGSAAGGRRLLVLARGVVLATGGLGRLYLRTTNPREATGDGLAMAARAGARLADVELVQFHPTALAAGGDPMPLVTEALRGEGALLVDGTGRRFMLDEHPDAELAPRDVVARAIASLLAAGGTAFLDAREAVGEAFPERFPQVFALCLGAGLDPRREPLPVAPAAHYHMGGIAVDAWGRSSLGGLWACGEVASTGVHGANRLASNSLLEAVVFGRRVAEDLDVHLPPPAAVPRAIAAAERPDHGDEGSAAVVTAEIRRLAWERLGLVRDEAALAVAEGRLAELAAAHPTLGGEAGNLLTAGRLVAAAARARRESRGGHFRADFPHPDPAWQRRLLATLSDDGRIVLTAEQTSAVPVAAVAG